MRVDFTFVLKEREARRELRLDSGVKSSWECRETG